MKFLANSPRLLSEWTTIRELPATRVLMAHLDTRPPRIHSVDRSDNFRFCKLPLCQRPASLFVPKSYLLLVQFLG